MVIDNKLSFVSHITKMCKESAKILNSLNRQNNFLIGVNTRAMFVNAMFYHNLIIAQLYGIFVEKGQLIKLKNFMREP